MGRANVAARLACQFREVIAPAAMRETSFISRKNKATLITALIYSSRDREPAFRRIFIYSLGQIFTQTRYKLVFGQTCLLNEIG